MHGITPDSKPLYVSFGESQNMIEAKLERLQPGYGQLPPDGSAPPRPTAVLNVTPWEDIRAIQTLTNLSDGSGLAVTVAGYVTPSGRDIQGQGIQPDRILDQPEPLNPGGEGDRWLNDAERVLQALIEQEHPSDQIQPLDSTDVASQPS